MNYFTINGKQININYDYLPNPNINIIKWKNKNIFYYFDTKIRFDFDKFNKRIKDKNNEI